MRSDKGLFDVLPDVADGIQDDCILGNSAEVQHSSSDQLWQLHASAADSEAWLGMLRMGNYLKCNPSASSSRLRAAVVDGFSGWAIHASVLPMCAMPCGRRATGTTTPFATGGSGSGYDVNQLSQSPDSSRP